MSEAAEAEEFGQRRGRKGHSKASSRSSLTASTSGFCRSRSSQVRYSNLQAGSAGQVFYLSRPEPTGDRRGRPGRRRRDCATTSISAKATPFIKASCLRADAGWPENALRHPAGARRSWRPEPTWSIDMGHRVAVRERRRRSCGLRWRRR